MFKSLASVAAYSQEAAGELARGIPLSRLRTGSLVQAAWMGGGITWALFGWGWGLAGFLMMWAVMATAVRNAQGIILLAQAQATEEDTASS